MRMILLTAVAVTVTVMVANFLLYAHALRQHGPRRVSAAVDHAALRRNFLRETLALLFILWTWPLNLVMNRRRPAAADPALRVLLIVPEFAFGRLAYTPLRTELAELDYTVFITAHRVACWLPRSFAPAAPLTIVAHGTGGLRAREYVQRHPQPSGTRLITLGTPHQGTHSLAARGPLAFMRAGSAYLRQLHHGPDLGATELVAIRSPFDAWVSPPHNGECAGACNITIEDVGHAEMIFSARVLQLLRENLD